MLGECERRGADVVVRACANMLGGGDVDASLVATLGGDHATYVLAGAEGGVGGYWPRVWAARGLLHVWSDEATEAVVAGARDEAWRVREMVAKVVARHHVDGALAAVETLRHDQVPRVRRAAQRALVALASDDDRQRS